MTDNRNIILSVQNLSLSFGGIKALNNLDLFIREGEIFTIIGPNGSGKTSLFNCIGGIYKPDSGKIIFEKEGQKIDITRMKPYKIAKLGISRTFQNIKLFSRMTCLDNILLGMHIHFLSGFILTSLGLNKKEYENHRRICEEIMDFLGLEVYRETRVADVPMGIQRKIELARALALRPKLMLLDEPTAGLTSEEKMEFSYYIKEIREKFGVTVAIIEHDVKVVMQISDRMMTLNYGMKIAEGIPEDVCKHPEVIKAYIGI